MVAIMKSQQFTRKFNCVYALSYHLVLVTKRRQKLLDADAFVIAREMVQARVNARAGTVIEFGGESDHIHILVSLPPAEAIADFVNAVKTSTSRRLRRDVSRIRNAGPALWSPSYFVASCGHADADTVRAYIQAQDGPDPT